MARNNRIGGHKRVARSGRVARRKRIAANKRRIELKSGTIMARNSEITRPEHYRSRFAFRAAYLPSFASLEKRKKKKLEGNGASSREESAMCDPRPDDVLV